MRVCIGMYNGIALITTFRKKPSVMLTEDREHCNVFDGDRVVYMVFLYPPR